MGKCMGENQPIEYNNIRSSAKYKSPSCVFEIFKLSSNGSSAQISIHDWKAKTITATEMVYFLWRIFIMIMEITES